MTRITLFVLVAITPLLTSAQPEQTCELRSNLVESFVNEHGLPLPGLAEPTLGVETLPSELQPPFSHHEACVVGRAGALLALCAVVLVGDDGELFNGQSVEGFNKVLAREQLIVRNQEEAFTLASSFRKLKYRGITELFPTIRLVADIDGIDSPDEVQRLELQYGISAPSVSENAHEFRYEEFGWNSKNGTLTRVRILVSKERPAQVSFVEDVLEENLGEYGKY